MYTSRTVTGGKGRRASTTALALLAASCFLVGTASTAGAAVEVIEEKFDFVMVRAQSLTGPEGCSSGATHLHATEEYVSFEQFCVDTQTGVFGSASPTTFDVADDGTRVHVVAELELFDEMGESAGVIELDNTWTASGRATRLKARFVENLPGDHRVTYRMKGLRSPATVSGTVPLDEGFIDTSTATLVSRTRV